jgi:hypothetical protein
VISSQQGNAFSKNNVTFCQSSDQLRKSISEGGRSYGEGGLGMMPPTGVTSNGTMSLAAENLSIDQSHGKYTFMTPTSDK